MQICFPDIEYDSAVKPYWNNTCYKLSENLFLPALINNKPKLIKKVFYSLPQYIIGKGISWGFCDTEVKDEIYIHIRNNKDLYKKIT